MKKYIDLLLGLIIAVTNYFKDIIPFPSLLNYKRVVGVDRLLDTVAILLMVIISYVWNKRKYFVGWMIAFVISAALGLFLTVRYSDFVEEHVCEENQTLTGGQSFKPEFVPIYRQSWGDIAMQPCVIIKQGYDRDNIWEPAVILASGKKLTMFHAWLQAAWAICFLIGVHAIFCIKNIKSLGVGGV